MMNIIRSKTRFIVVILCTGNAIVLLNHAILSYNNNVSSDNTNHITNAGNFVAYRTDKTKVGVDSTQSTVTSRINNSGNIVAHQIENINLQADVIQANVPRPLGNSHTKNAGNIVAHKIETTKVQVAPTRKIINKENSELDIDKIYTTANYSNLALTHHVSKLISSFRCSIHPIKFLILVTSMVSSFNRRQTIRKTWGKILHSQVNNDFKTFFAVGYSTDKDIMKKVNEESHIYKDIIFGDFKEIFYNLPYKVEIGFEWAYKHCSYDYYLKVDDDVFVNVPNLLLFTALRHTPKKTLYLGNKHARPQVYRHGKYKVTKEEYVKSIYPPFISGGGILFSNDAVKGLIPYFRKYPFKLDDVYIGMLAMNAGLEATHRNNFKVFMITDCEYNNYAFVYHIVVSDKESCMHQLFNSMIGANTIHGFIRKHYNDIYA